MVSSATVCTIVESTGQSSASSRPTQGKNHCRLITSKDKFPKSRERNRNDTFANLRESLAFPLRSLVSLGPACPHVHTPCRERLNLRRGRPGRARYCS